GVGRAKPERRERPAGEAAAQAHGAGLDARAVGVVEARAVEPEELLDATRAPDVLLDGGRAAEVVPRAVDHDRPVAADLAVRVRDAGGEREVVEEPRRAACRPRRGGEADIPRDLVAAGGDRAACRAVRERRVPDP